MQPALVSDGAGCRVWGFGVEGVCVGGGTSPSTLEGTTVRGFPVLV